MFNELIFFQKITQRNCWRSMSKSCRRCTITTRHTNKSLTLWSSVTSFGMRCWSLRCMVHLFFFCTDQHCNNTHPRLDSVDTWYSYNIVSNYMNFKTGGGGGGCVGFSLPCEDFLRTFDNFFSAWAFLGVFFFKVKISSHTLAPLFRPGSVHSGSASWDWDDCGWVFPVKLCVSSFLDRFSHCAWTADSKPTLTLLGQGCNVLRCNLPAALWAKWLVSFMCHCDKSQHTKLTLEKKVLPLLLPGFELATFWSGVWRFTKRLSQPPCETVGLVKLSSFLTHMSAELQTERLTVISSSFVPQVNVSVMCFMEPISLKNRQQFSTMECLCACQKKNLHINEWFLLVKLLLL